MSTATAPAAARSRLPGFLGRVPGPRLAAGVLLLAAVLYPVVNPWSPYTQGVALLAFLLAIQASSWNIISGYAGYTSLGHSMFLGLGSYTTAIIALHTGVNPLWIVPLGGITAVVVATIAGWVVLRTRGHAFVIITIALLLAAQILAVNLRGLTKGSDGITLELPFWSKDYQNIPFYYVFLLLLVLTVAFSAWIRRTKFGTGLVAIREDEGKAAAIGVDTTRFKILAFAASSFFIGVAGGVYAYFLTFLNPVGSFAILGSVMIVLSALLGGRGTLYGPVVGALIVQLLNEEATVYGGGTGTRVLLMGLVLVAVVLFMPAGLLPTVRAAWRRRHPVEVEYTDQTGALGRANAPATTRALEELGTAAADDLAAGEPLLELKGVSKRFGGLVAVDDADLTVRKGTITALIGPNGSGKTTLFNLVTGGMQADAGEIWFEGQRIDRLPPWKRGHLGLGRTFQVTRLFKEMTVLQNVVAPVPDG
ncbi:MAG TPA: ATP-binding cassette domain-containing protein, partial [Mycobacteriales bacterium]